MRPTESEGWAKAEVTVGGIDTNGLSSKTMEAREVPGLYLIGEAVDVTGWLGGYNFQWAWSSGWCAGNGGIAALCQVAFLALRGLIRTVRSRSTRCRVWTKPRSTALIRVW